jgi:hypothetical protein
VGGYQSHYYQCDEKLFTTIKEMHTRVRWVKRPDLVGEIPLAPRGPVDQISIKEKPYIASDFSCIQI